MSFDYFKGMESQKFASYYVPSALIIEPEFEKLSTDSKILYAMMMDRMQASVKNGWIDEEGRVFIIYEVKHIMHDMCCGNQKVSKLLSELEKFGLIIKKRQGYGKPAWIYVMNFANRLEKSAIA